MPDGDVRIFGADTHVPRKYAPLALAGAGIAVLLALRARAQASNSGGASNVPATITAGQQQNNAFALEFYQAQAAAQYQIAQLLSANAIQKQQINQAYQLAAGVNPGLLQQCIPLVTWYNTAADVRNNLMQQVRDGQLFTSIGPNGICFAPTQQGISGHQPFVTAKSSKGLFSGSSSVTGPAGSVPTSPPASPDPGLFGLVDILATVLADIGVVTPTPMPSNSTPVPSVIYA